MPEDVVVVVSDSPPLDPMVNQLWWNSSTGNLFIYFDDGTSKQWVQSGGGGSGGSGIGLAEPPADDLTYGRKTDLVNASKWDELIADAIHDGQTYARRDGTWVEVLPIIRGREVLFQHEGDRRYAPKDLVKVIGLYKMRIDNLKEDLSELGERVKTLASTNASMLARINQLEAKLQRRNS